MNRNRIATSKEEILNVKSWCHKALHAAHYMLMTWNECWAHLNPFFWQDMRYRIVVDGFSCFSLQVHFFVQGQKSSRYTETSGKEKHITAVNFKSTDLQRKSMQNSGQCRSCVIPYWHIYDSVLLETHYVRDCNTLCQTYWRSSWSMQTWDQQL